MLVAAGAPRQTIERDLALRRELTKAVNESTPQEKPAKIMASGVKNFLATLPEADREAARPPKAVVKQFEIYTTPWFRFFLKHDPRPVLRKVRCPVLAVFR